MTQPVTQWAGKFWYDQFITAREDGWYWTDETGSDTGPYDTKAEAINAIERYAEHLNGEVNDDSDILFCSG